MAPKDKTITLLLIFFLGTLGIHRFYLRQTGMGIVYLLLCWTGLSTLFTIVDFIGFLFMSQSTFDAKYNAHAYRR